MKSYVLPVMVQAFQIDRIEGFPRFPYRMNELPTPIVGGMRMVYSSDPKERPRCVSSAFIDAIRPKQDGYYVEYPDGYAVFMDADTFEKTSGAELVGGGMSFATALTLARKGERVYRKGWMMDGIYLTVTRRPHSMPDQEVLQMHDEKSQRGTSRAWTPGQTDMFENDWAIYEGLKK